MEKVYKPPSILRLIGITLADYVPVEDMADGRLLHPGTEAGSSPEDSDLVSETTLPLDKIPRVFTGLEDWPHRTNLLCWSCGFSFDDSPKFEVTFVREGEKGGIEFGVRGNMCTFNCVEAWIETQYGAHANSEKRWRAQDNLCLAYFMFTGRRVSRIKPAPSRTELRQYGGELDEDAFWAKLRELDPVAGLRDHRPGSVVPERERTRVALASLCPGESRRPQFSPSASSASRSVCSVWSACRATLGPSFPAAGTPPGGAVETDFVAVTPAPEGVPGLESLGPDASLLAAAFESSVAEDSVADESSGPGGPTLDDFGALLGLS